MGEVACGGAGGVVGEYEAVVDGRAELAEERGEAGWGGGCGEDLLEGFGAHAGDRGRDSGGGVAAVEFLGRGEPGCGVVLWGGVSEGGGGAGFGDEGVDDGVAGPGVVVVVDRGSCSCW